MAVIGLPACDGDLYLQLTRIPFIHHISIRIGFRDATCLGKFIPLSVGNYV